MKNNSNYFIDPKKNDYFSYLKGIDLQELIIQIENFYLSYRDTLNLPPNISFGVEIEYEKLSKSKVDEYVKLNLPFWISKYDGTVDGEINSPILFDDVDMWQELKSICQYLKDNKVDTCGNAGGHIHIGTHILGNNFANWEKFLKVYIAYESIIFRFLYGDKVSGRKNIDTYAKSMADILYKNIKKIKNIHDLRAIIMNFQKYHAINFQNVDIYNLNEFFEDNTIEFRSPNATIEEIVWQNNINMLTKLLLAPSYNLIDEEFIDYKLKHERVSSYFDSNMYNQICLKNALEFVDLIFDNNLDKIYFLRQYFKSFQENLHSNQVVLAKKFIK